MDYSQSFFRKYFRSGMLLLLLFFIVNAVLIPVVLYIIANRADYNNVPLDAIAACFSLDEQGKVTTAAETDSLLAEQNAWAMVLNDSGSVIWESKLPPELPRQYTSSDIAQFSRWYLNDYPVLIHLFSQGMLVVGYPPDSMSKLYYVTYPNFSNLLIGGSIMALSVNMLLIILLFRRNNRKLEKAVVPVLQSIEALAQGQNVDLPASGELAAINTSLNRAGQYIAQKDQARSEWISGISHDVRTPLSVVLGYAGEIEDDSALPPVTREQAGLIRKQGEKLRRLIADLNLTSKLEYSMQPLHIGTVYPVELARQVISDFLNNGLEDLYTLELEAAPDTTALTLQGDTALLTRMLSNLIQNSITHNPQGCRITVSIQQRNKSAAFIIKDNGVGIAASQLTQFNAGIFSEQHLQQGHETAHGIGLRLVQQIARAHGGTIEFANSSTGSGLCVSLIFPL